MSIVTFLFVIGLFFCPECIFSFQILLNFQLALKEKVIFAKTKTSLNFTYRVSRQVLDSLIECDNPIGLWWVWVAYPKTTIPYQDGCLPQPSGTKPFLKNPNNCYSPNNLNNCYNPNNFSHFGHYIFQRQLINQVNVGMGGGTQYHGTMVPQDYTKN